MVATAPVPAGEGDPVASLETSPGVINVTASRRSPSSDDGVGLPLHPCSCIQRLRAAACARTPARGGPTCRGWTAHSILPHVCPAPAAGRRPGPREASSGDATRTRRVPPVGAEGSSGTAAWARPNPRDASRRFRNFRNSRRCNWRGFRTGPHHTRPSHSSGERWRRRSWHFAASRSAA
jgi:hypothetical protein